MGKESTDYADYTDDTNVLLLYVIGGITERF